MGVKEDLRKPISRKDLVLLFVIVIVPIAVGIGYMEYRTLIEKKVMAQYEKVEVGMSLDAVKQQLKEPAYKYEYSEEGCLIYSPVGLGGDYFVVTVQDNVVTEKVKRQ